MTTKTINSNQARVHWGDTLQLAMSAETDVIITRHNEPIVAVVAYEDYLAVRDFLHQQRVKRQRRDLRMRESRATMYATEAVLQKEWDTPEEDEAWADL